MSERQTHALAKTPLDGRIADGAETVHGRDLATAMIGVAFTSLRHEIENNDASSRAQSRARAALRSLVARFDDAPHACDPIISELSPTSREITLARENPNAMQTLAEARANAVAMMVESGITSVRGQLDFAIAARMRVVADAMLDDPSRAAAAADMLTKAVALQDRAVEADARIRAQQRDDRQREEWERRSLPIVIEDRRALFDPRHNTVRSSIPDPDPIEHAQATIKVLLARKIEAGVAFINPSDDTINIRPATQPHPDAAKKLANVAVATKGTSPFDRGAKVTTKMTPAQLAERGIYSDSVIDPHPLAVAEAERQRLEREEREREFKGGIGRVSGRIGEWKPQPREPEQAGWEKLRELRELRETNDDEDEEQSP